MNLFTKQECISVGCVPSTTVTVCWRGGLHHSPGSRHPPRAGTNPMGAGTPPCQIPLNFPQWLWAWTRSPSTSPLVVGLDQIPLNFPLGCVPGPDPPQLPPWLWAWRPPWPDPPKLPPWVWVWKPARHAGIPPPKTCCKACWDATSCGQTDTCKNVTFATSLRTVNICTRT